MKSEIPKDNLNNLKIFLQIQKSTEDIVRKVIQIYIKL